MSCPLLAAVQLMIDLSEAALAGEDPVALRCRGDGTHVELRIEGLQHIVFCEEDLAIGYVLAYVARDEGADDSPAPTQLRHEVGMDVAIPEEICRQASSAAFDRQDCSHAGLGPIRDLGDVVADRQA